MALVEAHSEAAVEAPGHEARWELDAEETRRGVHDRWDGRGDRIDSR